MKNKKNILLILSIAALVVLGIVLSLTQPWRAFTSSTIDEALPESTQTQPATSNAQQPTAQSTPTPQTATQGTFHSIDHDTTGTAAIITLNDGTHLLRLEDLSTLDGPDLKVILTDKTGDFTTLTAEDYTNLGDLKATNGNQNYPIPSNVDINTIKSVIIWCERFSSPFGAATLN
ncbi:DM13 domain-containing protein [Rothia sp. P7181]|uniref:DM13 domain-containing protein n=1 Tax=Rothia sp. P7181 TaxID=3402663 RepID=UPI003AE6C2C7